MGPAPGCPFGQAGVCGTSDGGESISQETTSLFPILILKQMCLGLAVRRLEFVEIELLGLRLGLTMGVVRSTTRLTPTTLKEGNLEIVLGNKSIIVKGSTFKEMNLKNRAFAREHLRALSNQAAKAWWVRRTH